MQLLRLAAAFELTLAEVQRDWRLVHTAGDGHRNAVEQLRQQHGWDPSVAPHYVRWLERARVS